MSTYTQILYQIIFSTKNREQTLVAEHRKELFKYIWGILQNKKCHLYQMNGVEDHLHIFTHLHPSVALADLIKDIGGAGHLDVRLVEHDGVARSFDHAAAHRHHAIVWAGDER